MENETDTAEGRQLARCRFLIAHLSQQLAEACVTAQLLREALAKSNADQPEGVRGGIA